MATAQQDTQPARDLVVADSTALTRSSDEDEATSSARRDGSQEPLTPPRPSFATLPTEILNQIYSHLAECLPRAHSVAVNKRIFRIARRFAVRNIHVEYDCTEELAWVPTPNSALSNVALSDVKYIQGSPQAFLPDYSVLTKLSHLTHLSIILDDPTMDNDAASPLPDSFFDVLKSLRHLVCLDIEHARQDEPEDFSFERDVPTLRELSISVIGTLSAWAPGLAKLERLTVHWPTDAEAAIPWRTLRHLAFLDLERADGPPDLYQVLESLETACRSKAIPLQSLVLSERCLRSPDEPDQPSFADIAEALCATHLTDLSLVDVWDLSQWCVERVTLPLVLRLTLSTSELVESFAWSDLECLQAIVMLFPALQSLRLTQIPLHAGDYILDRAQNTEAKVAILRSIEQGDLASAFPAVAASLDFLRPTPVVDFLFEPSIGVGIHWRRFSKDEDFVAEGWTAI